MKHSGNAAPRASGNGRHIIMGTAGHIDHGKTSLVYVLTGTDTDRLPEEKQRGITIDLGFAELALEDERGETLHLSLVDVPGHHAFIRNMLAGTGGIDCVLLVIAADDGVKAQTIEHLDICALLGIERGVIALTKCDAVSSERLVQVTEQVRQFARSTFLQHAAIVPVSALRGDGLGDLRRAIADMASQVPVRSRNVVTRLPLDRSFSIRGFGTVVTGTLHSGSIAVGDSLEQQPGGRVLRVRSLEVHGKPQQQADAPCRVALNLPGVEVQQIGRGHTLIPADTLASASTVDVQLTMLADAPALRHGARVHVHAFTAETVGRVLLYDQRDTIAPGSGFARLKLAAPLLLVPDDRIVLRQSSPARTIGAACVLDTAPVAGQRKHATLAWLAKLAAGDAGEQLALRIDRRDVGGMSMHELVRETGLASEALAAQLKPVLASGSVLELTIERTYVSAKAMDRAVQRLASEVATAGTLPRAEARSRCRVADAVFEAALKRLLSSSSIEFAGDVLCKRGEQIPEQKRQQMQAIERIYEHAGLAAPLQAEVAKQLGLTQSAMRELMTLLLRAKRLVRLGADDALVHAEALEKLYDQMRGYRGETFDVGRFKTLTGLTRKHAIPLLEHLDQARITRNSGGTRVVL